MPKIFVLLLLALSARVLHAQSETIDLRSRGALTFFLDGEWKVDISEFGDRVIVAIEPTGDANANCNLTITFPEEDHFPTKAKLKQQVEIASRQLEEGSVERKAVARELQTRAGVGFYCNFTDPELVGKKPQKGNYKTISVGFIRVAPNVVVEMAINSDGFRTAPYQQLLGALEGMEYQSRRRGAMNRTQPEPRPSAARASERAVRVLPVGISG
ncbi:MAG TPA: hypothetical protein VHO24_07365 [Opitutaceae bacterium]|nr:hypothetical protein [Opitutaceae bacterium]